MWRLCTIYDLIHDFDLSAGKLQRRWWRQSGKKTEEKKFKRKNDAFRFSTVNRFSKRFKKQKTKSKTDKLLRCDRSNLVWMVKNSSENGWKIKYQQQQIERRFDSIRIDVTWTSQCLCRLFLFCYRQFSDLLVCQSRRNSLCTNGGEWERVTLKESRRWHSFQNTLCIYLSIATGNRKLNFFLPQSTKRNTRTGSTQRER